MPRKMLAATARAEAPPRPMVFWNRMPKPCVSHFSIFQCHSKADRAEMTRIIGRTLKANVNIPPALVTA